ncbi:MAG: hypothetical protein WHS45_05250 [Anaerolinea sp.]
MSLLGDAPFVQTSGGGTVTPLPPLQMPASLHRGWRLRLPAGDERSYRLAQIEQGPFRTRAEFPLTPPVEWTLWARVSAPDLPGTWGFGFWNEPFSVGLGVSGMRRALPVLPNALWYFYASPPSYLSLRNDSPGRGWMGMVFSSPLAPPVTWLPALPLLAGLLFPASRRALRRLARRWIRDQAVLLPVEVTGWHRYTLRWERDRVSFTIDNTWTHTMPLSPRGRMKALAWIDNQMAFFDPQGRLGSGVLANPAAWLEIGEE